MKKFIVKISKVEIHLSTFLFCFFALVFGRFQTYLFLFSFTFIHELFHALTALFYKVKVEKICIFPFGFCARMESLINVEWYKELVIVIAGPLSYFFSELLIKLIYNYNIISYVGMQNANSTNLFILCFNLLPIIPLDGSKIIKILLEFFLVEKKSMQISGIISLVSLIIYMIVLPAQFTIYLFLIYSQSEYWYYFRSTYSLFLISRLKKFKLKYKIHNKNDFFRNYHNLFIKKDKIYNEEEYLRKIYGVIKWKKY